MYFVILKVYNNLEKILQMNQNKLNVRITAYEGNKFKKKQV